MAKKRIKRAPVSRKVKKAKSSKPKKAAKAARRKKRSKATFPPLRKQEPEDLVSKLKDKRMWLLVGFALAVALVLQQFNLVTLAVKDDLLPSCSKDAHCQVGKHCIFGQCYAHTPAYPEIGEVTVHYADGTEVLPDNQGFYNIAPGELMLLQVMADNQGDPFRLEVFSPLGFGLKGLEQNRQRYLAPGGPQEDKGLYWVRVDDARRDHTYPFYFELVGFRGEKFNMFVYLKNLSDVEQTKSQIVQIPVKMI